MWLPVYSICTIFCALYIHLHASCGHLHCGQVGDCVLCNPHSQVKSCHLYSETHGAEKCHEDIIEEESKSGCLQSLESDDLYTQGGYYTSWKYQRKLINLADYWKNKSLGK